jgi:hypothetical protein
MTRGEKIFYAGGLSAIVALGTGADVALYYGGPAMAKAANAVSARTTVQVPVAEAVRPQLKAGAKYLCDVSASGDVLGCTPR